MTAVWREGCGIAEAQKGERNGTTSCQTQGHGLFQRSASLGLLTFRRTPSPSERAITNYARAGLVVRQENVRDAGIADVPSNGLIQRDPPYDV